MNNSKNHFDTIAEVFNRIWYFSDEYTRFVIRHILDDLELSANDILADIGGGTGSFTSRLTDEADVQKAYCIEPSRSMCDEAAKHKNITVVCGDGDAFLDKKISFTKLLLKEVIHHIPHRKEFWAKCFDQLQQDGKLLIITRPQEIAFPLFDEAKKAFARNQPPRELLESELSETGFLIETHGRSHTFTLSKASWYTMLRHRFMSDLGGFSDEEIEEGIHEIDKKYPEKSIEIIDHLIFITATKKVNLSRL